MLNPNLLRYGSSENLPRPISLRAGPLSLQYEDGDLRYIRCGEHELVRRIYMAVRDRNWGTILPVYTNMQMDIRPDRFDITFEAAHQRDEIHFTWRGTLQGAPDGTVSFRLEGQAVTSFLKNRIGLCVLHPASAAGKSCRVTQKGGVVQETVFPEWITADQPPLPFTDMTGLSYGAGAAKVEITLEGDLFEMEDQRNWSDASYKTFCPPLRFPYPCEISSGARVVQSVIVRTGLEKSAFLRPPASAAGLSLLVKSEPLGILPGLGTGIASHGEALSALEVDRLKRLRFTHLRADLRLDDPALPIELQRASAQSGSLGIPLYLALHISENGEEEIRQFAEMYRQAPPEVAAWLVYPAREMFQGGSPIGQVVNWVRKSALPGLSKRPFLLASGTDADFIFFLRSLPPFDQLQAACFAISPQVHAFDNASIVETLETQTRMVANARAISGGLPVLASPVTLRPRHNPYATGAGPEIPPGELPPQVDSRQPSLFAAAWLAGSLRAMAQGGASAITYFETTGWRGLMETGSGSHLPQKFHSIPGAVFPVYHILADVAEMYPAQSPGEVEALAMESSDALKIQALALRSRGRLRVLVINLTPDPQKVTVGGLPGRVGLRCLDETNAEQAMRHPEAYRAQPFEALTPYQRNLKIDLLPYAVATLEAS